MRFAIDAREAPRWLTRAVAVGGYLVLWFACLWPQSVDPIRRIAYVGDALESVYLVAWNAAHFLKPRELFHANDFYPLPYALGNTDHRLLPSVLVAPVLWATNNAVLAYNVAVVVASLLAALAARWAATRLGLSPLAAWTAGALYAFHTYQINEVPRLHIIFHGFLPIAVVSFVEFLRGKGTRWGWVTAIAGTAQGFASNYHVLYMALVLTIVLIVALMAAPRAVIPRLKGLVLPLVVGGALYSPIAFEYARASAVYGYQREISSGIDLRHLVTTPATNVLYGHMGLVSRLQQQGPHFIGFVSLALVGVGLADWVYRRGRTRYSNVAQPTDWWILGGLAVATVLVLLACGKDISLNGKALAPGPYRLLFNLVPGFQMVRIPERLTLPTMFFVGLLAGAGLDALRRGRIGLAALGFAVVVPLEHLAPLTGPRDAKPEQPHTTVIPVGSRVPDVYRWLADQPVQALAEFPPHRTMIRFETLEMYFSTFHWKRTIHGYGAYFPPLNQQLRGWAFDVPESLALRQLAGCGVDTVVLHVPPRHLLTTINDDLRHPLTHRMRAARAYIEAWAEHEAYEIQFPSYYSRFARLARDGELLELARFEGPDAVVRIRGGADIVYRIPGASAVGSSAPCRAEQEWG